MARYNAVSPTIVENFLLSETSFDANSVPNRDQIGQYIRQAEGEIVDRTNTAWWPVWVEEERHDVEAWRNRHRDLFHDQWWTVARPIHANHRPILPLSSSRGHQIEVYSGSTDADQEWTDFISTKTQGRGDDWWIDHDTGIVYIRKAFLIRRHALVRLTYEYGQPVQTLNGAVTDSDTTITLQAYHNRPATWGVPARGEGRINNEYITWTGKTDTDLTGVERGQYNTDAQAHSSGDEFQSIPWSVASAVTHYAAAKYLENNRFIAASADNAGSAEAISSLTDKWMERFDEFCGVDHGTMEVF